MEAGALLVFYFWSKIHEQAMKCEQVHYRDAKAYNYFATNPGVFSDHFTQTALNL